MGFFISVNGEITPAAAARVSALDTGFTFGDGAYETLRTYGGRPFHLDKHFRRLRQSIGRLGIALPLSDQELAARLRALLEAAGNAESYVRLMVTRGVGDVTYKFDRVQGPTVVMIVKPYEPLPERTYEIGAPVVISSVRRNHPLALDPAIKSINLLNNILAMQEAVAKGALEAILLNDLGEVAEGAGSNVFAVHRGTLLTPPLEAGILAGITREVVLALAREMGVPVQEDLLRVPDFLAADEAFLSSSLKEVVPIASIDGAPVGADTAWPMTRRLLAAYREYAPQHCG
jgi:branched-chain amino acid aminotransferase